MSYRYRSANRRRISSSERRWRSYDHSLLAVLAIVLLSLGVMLYGAAKVDQRNAITVSQSLQNWGL